MLRVQSSLPGSSLLSALTGSRTARWRKNTGFFPEVHLRPVTALLSIQQDPEQGSLFHRNPPWWL